jgi:hypothetical protein
MADFARIFKWLNTGFPPSSRELHQPGQLIDPVNLVHPVYTGGWSTPDWAAGLYASAAGQAIVSQGAPPNGSVRVVMAASAKWSNSGAGPYHFVITLNIAGTAQIVCWIASSYSEGAGGPLLMDQNIMLQRTVVFGPAFEMRGIRLGAVDAAATSHLTMAYIDLKYGEFDPAFVCS